MGYRQPLSSQASLTDDAREDIALLFASYWQTADLNPGLTVLPCASSVAPGCDFRTGCLTVLTVASTDIQLRAATKSLSSKFRSADHRDKLRSLVARFSTNLCPSATRRLRMTSKIGDFELKNGRGPGI
jgi:hypothetical protein